MRVQVIGVWGPWVEYEFDEFRPKMGEAHARRRYHQDFPGFEGAIYRVDVLATDSDVKKPPKVKLPSKPMTIKQELAKMLNG